MSATEDTSDGARALRDSVVVITGGASGIGRAMVLRFLADGARVVMGDLNGANAAALAEEVTGAGQADRLRCRATDVADEEQVAALVADAVDNFGGIDVMCNNAGVGGAFGPITDTERADWDYTMGILVTGVFLGIKHAARAMRAAGRGGSIINTASVAGLSGGAAPHAYSAAKAAVINLTRTTAMELAADRIRVNALCPGAINTPLINLGNPDAMGQLFDTVQPWPRHGTPEDVAAAAAFLASEDASFVTGAHLVVDGGLVAAGANLLERMGGGALSGLAGVSRGSTGQGADFRPVSGS